MREDKEGFLYPVIDENLCIDCGKCDNVCPIDKTIDSDSKFEKEYYAARVPDKRTRLESQSGGVCYLFSQHVIRSGTGVAYGVGYDRDWNAEHQRATTDETIRQFRGSKYVQSNIEKVYFTIIDDVRKDKVNRILVIGTPCQIAGIKSYLKLRKISFDKIIFADLICHGVPSPKIWRDYLNAEIDKEALTDVKFRNKRFGWSSHVETYKLNCRLIHKKTFTHFFNLEVISRPCCITCKYASYSREADITVGDFWGYKRIGIPYDSFGISECLINTEKGKIFFSECIDELCVSTITLKEADQYNLNQPTIIDEKKREAFWNLYYSGGYAALKGKYFPQYAQVERRLKMMYTIKWIKRLLLGK